MNHIIVSSFRRSGTHYLTDTIVNNFGYKRATVDLDCLKDMSERDVRVFKEECSGKQPIVFWTHAQKYDDIVNEITDRQFADFVKEKIDNMKLIYIYRDGRDVLTSYWHMKKTDHPLSTFISYTAPIWKENIENWMGKDYYEVNFESLRGEYVETVKRLSRYIKMEHKCPIVDVTLESPDERKDNVVYSDREFRKGIVGDHKNYFGFEEKTNFQNICGALMEKLGYA